MALPGPRFEMDKSLREFRPLKVAVTAGLKSPAIIAPSNASGAELALEFALICEELLKLGLFSTHEEVAQDVIPALLLHLNPAQEKDKGKADDASSSSLGKSAVLAKVVVCRMLDYICDLRLRVRVPKLLALYKVNAGIMSTAQEDGTLTKEELEAEVLHKLTEKLRTGHADDLTKLLAFLSLSTSPVEGERLAVQLVKMMQSEVEELSLMSLRLLLRERTPKLELYRELSNTQVLLDPGAITGYHSCIEQGARLHKLVPLAARELRQLHLKRVGSFLNEQRKGTAVGLTHEQRNELKLAIKTCAEHCVAKSNSADHLRVASENKESVGRAFIHLRVLEVLENCRDPVTGNLLDFSRIGTLQSDASECAGEQGEDRDRLERIRFYSKELIFECIRFVEFFCRGSEKNQQIMAPHVRLILMFAGTGMHTTLAVSAIYQGNSKLCRSLEESSIACVVNVLAGGDRAPGGPRLSQEDRRKPHYLHFMRGLCSVNGIAVLQIHNYVLKQMSQRGPLKLQASRDIKKVTQLDMPAQEQALLLFRGEEGEKMRERLITEESGLEMGALSFIFQSSPFPSDAVKEMEVKVDAVVNSLQKASSMAIPSSKAVRLMAYNIELLSLILVIIEDYNPDIAQVICVFLPPTKIKDDVQSRSCLPRAKALTLQIMKNLYLKDDSQKPHPLLFECLWDMIEYLVDELKAASLDEFSRYNTKRSPWALPEQLCHFWAPMLLAAFKHPKLMLEVSDHHMSLAGALLDRLVDILNECTLHPYDAAGLLALYKAAKQCHVPTAAILSDQALEHAESISEKDKLAIAAGNLVPPPVQVEDVANRRDERHDAVQAPAGNAATADVNDVTEAVHKNIDIFARAFLDAQDPLSSEAQEDEAEDEAPKERGELLLLCKAFQANSLYVKGAGAGTGGVAALVGASQGGSVSGVVGVGEFNADDTAYLVTRICRYPPGSAGTAERLQWEQDVILGVKVLRLLVRLWRTSVTESDPPQWLLDGVPRLIVQILSMRDCGDRVTASVLELGIEVLHGGEETFQNSLYNMMMKGEDGVGAGAPDLFAHLQDRLRRAEAEGRISHRIRFDQGPQRAVMEELIQSGKQRDVHALIVLAAKNDPRLETSHVGLVIRFMHLLCEGHNMKLQDFLRTQPGSSRAVDMVSGVANYVDAVIPYINPRIVKDVTIAMSALSEFVQNPCRMNQRVLVDTRLCACANEILEKQGHDESLERVQEVAQEERSTTKHLNECKRAKKEQVEYQHQINDLKSATATTLLSLLECVDHPYIPERMLASLDSDRLIDNMNGLLKVPRMRD